MTNPTVPTGPNVAFCKTLVRAWAALGVQYGVISPGSRSTPMAYALLDSEEIETFVRLDERSNGFFALGLAKATQRPTVIATTSGTGSAELLPAVTEAYYGGVPLIVCTTDRPPMLQGIGAPQTMAQSALFSGVVSERTLCNPPQIGESDSWVSLASQIYAGATKPGAFGPSHVNLPFDEPLFDTLDPDRVAGVLRTPTRSFGAPEGLSDADIVEIFDPRCSGVILVGGELTLESTHLGNLASLLGWPLVVESRALHALNGADGVLRYGDLILRDPDLWEGLVPQKVVIVGDEWSSKVLSSFLSWTSTAKGGCELIHLSSRVNYVDPRRNLDRRYWIDLHKTFLRAAQMISDIGPAVPNSITERWRAADAAVEELLWGAANEQTELSEPMAARVLFGELNANDTLTVASSMPIRDIEWFAARSGDDPLVYANRGVNGIDGMLSTFLGIRTAHQDRSSEGLSVGYVGDLAFLYDFSALFGAQSQRGLLVVTNNNGGAIFSFLAQAEQVEKDTFEEAFGTPHNLDLSQLAGAIGLGVRVCDTPSKLRSAVSEARDADRLVLAIVPSERTRNVTIHNQLTDAAKGVVRTIIG